MSRRLGILLEARSGSQRQAKTNRKSGRNAQAQRGVLLQGAREGNPTALLALLQRLESEGHVAIEDFADTERMTNEVMSTESVPEIDLNDEDDGPIEVWSGATE